MLLECLLDRPAESLACTAAGLLASLLLLGSEEDLGLWQDETEKCGKRGETGADVEEDLVRSVGGDGV